MTRPQERRPDGKTLAANLRRIREERDLSAVELSRRSGINEKTIWIWEGCSGGVKTCPQWSSIQKLARGLDMTTTELLTELAVPPDDQIEWVRGPGGVMRAASAATSRSRAPRR